MLAPRLNGNSSNSSRLRSHAANNGVVPFYIRRANSYNLVNRLRKQPHLFQHAPNDNKNYISSVNYTDSLCNHNVYSCLFKKMLFVTYLTNEADVSSSHNFVLQNSELLPSIYLLLTATMFAIWTDISIHK